MTKALCILLYAFVNKYFCIKYKAITYSTNDITCSNGQSERVITMTNLQIPQQELIFLHIEGPYCKVNTIMPMQCYSNL